VVTARLLPADPQGRQRLDRYELVGEIASGGMATVYLARRAGVGGFQRFVAIKRLHAHLAKESEFVEMFLDEARLAALIHHPNVISITEVGSSERGYYLVMDYVEGDTLARLLSIASEQNTVVPIGIGIRIVIDMLAGLHAAHELHDDQGVTLGLVHRDVSPQNVLVGTDGIARLSDFGVARAAIRLAGTRVGQLKGKIAYMAPEQAAADESIDRRADVFSAGIVLWEVLTGRRLFKSTNDAATLSRVVTDRIEPPVTYMEGLDTRISDICMKALERPLARRYQTAALFADQLEQTASRRGILASSKDVSAYLQKVLGGEITQQREAVRRWITTSDSTDELTPSGIPRPPGSQPRYEKFDPNADDPSSTSRMRRISSPSIPDPDPSDETQVGPAPRYVPPPRTWIAGGAISAAVILLIVFFVFSRRNHHPLPIAPAAKVTVIPIVGSPPSFGVGSEHDDPAVAGSPSSGSGNSAATNGGAASHISGPGAMGNVPGNGLPGNGLPGNGLPGNGLPGNGMPGNGLPGNGLPGNGLPGNGIESNGGATGGALSGSSPGAAGSPSKSARNTPTVPTTKPGTPAIPDVDLTNPYR